MYIPLVSRWAPFRPYHRLANCIVIPSRKAGHVVTRTFRNAGHRSTRSPLMYSSGTRFLRKACGSRVANRGLYKHNANGFVYQKSPDGARQKGWIWRALKRSRQRLGLTSIVVQPFLPRHVTRRYYPRHGPLPSFDNLRVNTAFLASFNPTLQTSRWVAERLTYPPDYKQVQTRRKPRWFLVEDPLSTTPKTTHRLFRPVRCWDTSLSRGHLAAAANHKYSVEAHRSTFLCPTNMVTQNIDANNGVWNVLETAVRQLTKSYATVYVVTGPLMLPDRLTEISSINLRALTAKTQILRQAAYPCLDSVLRVSYTTLGPGGPAVPTHLFKIIACSGPRTLSERLPSSSLLRAFVVPNTPVQNSLWRFRVPLAFIEQYSGLNFSGLKMYILRQLRTARCASEAPSQSQGHKRLRDIIMDTELRHIYMPLTQHDVDTNHAAWRSAWNLTVSVHGTQLTTDLRLKTSTDWFLMPPPTHVYNPRAGPQNKYRISPNPHRVYFAPKPLFRWSFEYDVHRPSARLASKTLKLLRNAAKQKEAHAFKEKRNVPQNTPETFPAQRPTEPELGTSIMLGLWQEVKRPVWLRLRAAQVTWDWVPNVRPLILRLESFLRDLLYAR